MKNIEQLHAQLATAGLPIVGVDGAGKISWAQAPTAPQASQASAIIAAFRDTDFDYLAARRKAFPPIGDQLDRMTKALAFINAKGVDIGPDGLDQVQAIDAIKAEFPKP